MPHPLLRLAPLFRSSTGLLAASMSGLVLGSCLNLVGPYLVATAIDRHLLPGDWGGLLRVAGLYLAVLAATLAATYLSRIGIEIAAQEAMVRLKRQLFAHLVEHDLAFHDQHPSGRLITRVQGDTEALRTLFTEVLLPLPADVVLFAGMFAVLGVVAPITVPVIFAVVPPYVVLFIVFRLVSPRLFLRVRAVKAVLTGFLAEHVRAMPTLMLFDRLGWARDRAEELNRQVARAEVISQLQPVWYFNSVVVVQRFGIVATLLFGGLLVAGEQLTLGTLLLGIGYLRLMFQPLMRLSNQLATLERARAAASRVAEILDTPRAIADPPNPVPWPGVHDAIRVEHCCFAYVDGAPVLTGVELEFPAGSNTGIVGATGAGKSTVLNLLLRFRDPTSGRVTVDGVDLRAMAVDDVRRHIGLVLQDVHLFAGTVLENLGGDEVRARRALNVVDLPIPLEHVLADGGSNLSRGERQLLTFARALVDDPEVLVLDEATSAVDPATEARVQAALERLKQGRTTITVAHRLATVEGCDAIYVLAGGEVQERGTHAELIARNGLYAALAQLQGLAA